MARSIHRAKVQCRAIVVLRVLDKNTIRNVTMVVPVLIMSCQYPKPQNRRLTAETNHEGTCDGESGGAAALPRCPRRAVLMEKGVEKDPCEQVSLRTCWLTLDFVVCAGMVSKPNRPFTAYVSASVGSK